MKTLKKTIYSLALLVILMLTSCVGKGNILNEADGLAKTKKSIEEIFGSDKEVYSLSVGSKDHLNSEFGNASIEYLQDGKSYRQDYNVAYDDIEEELEEPRMHSESFQTTFFLKNKRGKLAIKDFDFDMILVKYEEAIKIISEGFDEDYEDFILYKWEFEVENNGDITADFVLEGTKKGEGNSMQGRNIVTNYYEFPFEMDEKGNIEFDE